MTDLPTPAVSVIIPVYNTETYLTECLDSVLNQNFRDMEILIVNDGSTDNSLNVIRKYMAIDQRIVLLDKKNEGVAAARNAALRMAKGDYLMLLDSDDIFAPNAIATLYDQIRQNDCDILIYNGRSFEVGGANKRWAGKYYFDLNEADENRVAPGLYWLERTDGRIQQACMKIYRRQFIVGHKLDFGRYRIGEDSYFFYMSMIRARRVAYVHYTGYFRRYRPGSIVTTESVHGPQTRIRSFGQLTSTLDEALDEKHRKLIARQHAYYASALWILCMIRREAADRDALMKEFGNAHLAQFIRENMRDWKLAVLAFFISLPECFIPLQVAFARLLRWAYKSKARLLYFS